MENFELNKPPDAEVVVAGCESNINTHEKGSVDNVVQSISDDAESNVSTYKKLSGNENAAENDHLIINQLKPQIRRLIKTHQIEGLTFMMRNITAGRGCILAHSMGLGKTMQIIALCDIFLANSSKKILLVMPVNTIRHVLAEFDYWLPLKSHKDFISRHFSVFVISDLQRSLNARFKVFSDWSQNGGVLIVGYEMFRLLVSKNTLKRTRNEEESAMQNGIKKSLISSDLVICDEGHRIKQIDSETFTTLQELKTKLRVIVTGYPLQNNLKEYYALVNYAVPNFLGTENEFKMLFLLPIIMGQYSDSSAAEVTLMSHRTHVLQNLLSPLVHRRCEKVLLLNLPDKIEFTLLFKMTNIQKELYKKVVKLSNNNPVNNFPIVCKIMNDPNILFNYMKNGSAPQKDIEDDDEKSNGNICYEHLESIMEGYVPKLIDTSPKMIILFQLIGYTVELKEKMIIFSQSLSTLDMIETCLQAKLNWKLNLHYYRLDGSVSQLSRQNMIDKFNGNSESKVFLISTKAGCLGITLVGANRVVLFDTSFNPSNDLQAIGRVYRYGQTRKTFVYRFVMDNCLEKSIYQHQIRKQQIAKRIVDMQNPQHY